MQSCWFEYVITHLEKLCQTYYSKLFETILIHILLLKLSYDINKNFVSAALAPNQFEIFPESLITILLPQKSAKIYKSVS